MRKLNPLEYLERSDKWYLGGGDRLLWAPPFPVWLDYPGFWDKAHYFNFEIEPVFTWTILDEEGNEIPLRAETRKWDPSKLTTGYAIREIGYEVHARPESRIQYLSSALGISEEKTCLPNDVLASVVRLKNTSAKRMKLHFIAWTTQPNYPSKQTTWLSDVGFRDQQVHFKKYIQNSNTPEFHCSCSLSITRKVESSCISLSEGSTLQPHWNLTPLYEKFRNGRLPSDVALSAVNDEGLVHLALHTRVELRARSEEPLAVFFTVSPTQVESTANIHFSKKQENLIKLSEQNWNDHFSGIPSFGCSDEFLSRYYYYRWYGLKLNTVDALEGNYKHPFVCEGIGYFRAPISYSAPCHMLENRWMHTPALAQGSLLTFLDNQRDDGGFRGYVDPFHYRQEMFYHANWGEALRELHAVHPDLDFLSRVYDGLVRYVRFFDGKRDAERSGLYDIENHYETGQEYMHRYLAVNPNADRDNWGEIFRLKGVDVTVYVYELKKTLAWIGETLHRGNAEVAEYRGGAQKIKQAILEKMWDPEEEMFLDVDPATGHRTTVKALTCFYPYMTDIVAEKHVPGLKRHLLNPKEFWTKFPLPSSSADDEYFSAGAEWKGKRMNCPWNGRVWPMTNSHLAEALFRTAVGFKSKELRAKSVDFMMKYVRMMFLHGDPLLPNAFEHYNPFTGEPSLYRGVDDYMHSWVVDLIIKYVGGIRPQANNLVIDPMPFPLKWMKLEEVMIRGQRVNVVRDNRKFKVALNGRRGGESVIGVPILLKLQ